MPLVWVEGRKEENFPQISSSRLGPRTRLCRRPFCRPDRLSDRPTGAPNNGRYPCQALRTGCRLPVSRRVDLHFPVGVRLLPHLVSEPVRGRSLANGRERDTTGATETAEGTNFSGYNQYVLETGTSASTVEGP